MYKRILIPLDGSQLAEMAVEHAIHLAQIENSELHLIRAWHKNEHLDHPFPVEPDWDKMKLHRQAYLKMIANRIETEGLPIEVHLEERDAAEAILATAKSLNVDLIVMTTHGHGGLTRFLMGSVTDKVVRHANCPVFVVRHTKRD